jgi:hypothetical protein
MILATGFGFLLIAHSIVVNANSNSSGNSQSIPVHVSLPAGESMQILVPSSSNITLVSVNASQYDISIQNGARTNSLTFSPYSTNGTFLLMVEVLSYQNTYALVKNQSVTSPQESGKNITGTGDLLLAITATITPPTQNQNAVWNPLSGFTGLGFSLGGVSLSATDVLFIFVALSSCVIALGAKYNQKLLFFGLALLSITGWVALGLFGVGLIAGCYFLSFFVAKSYFGRGMKRERGY